jgi:hypothetical protein
MEAKPGLKNQAFGRGFRRVQLRWSLEFHTSLVTKELLCLSFWVSCAHVCVLKNLFFLNRIWRSDFGVVLRLAASRSNLFCRLLNLFC